MVYELMYVNMDFFLVIQYFKNRLKLHDYSFITGTRYYSLVASAQTLVPNYITNARWQFGTFWLDFCAMQESEDTSSIFILFRGRDDLSF